MVPDLTFCAGSLSAGAYNDVVGMAKKFASRTHFIHLRSCHIFPNGDFTEASHLGGRADLIELVRIFEKENPALPMRVDHGMTFTDAPGGIMDESATTPATPSSAACSPWARSRASSPPWTASWASPTNNPVFLIRL